MQSSLHLRVQLDNVSCMTSGPLTLNLIFKGILFSFFLSLWDLPGSGISVFCTGRRILYQSHQGSPNLVYFIGPPEEQMKL